MGCIVRWTVIIRVRALVSQVDSTLETLHRGGASQHEINGVARQSRCIFVKRGEGQDWKTVQNGLEVDTSGR